MPLVLKADFEEPLRYAVHAPTGLEFDELAFWRLVNLAQNRESTDAYLLNKYRTAVESLAILEKENPVRKDLVCLFRGQVLAIRYVVRGYRQHLVLPDLEPDTQLGGK